MRKRDRSKLAAVVAVTFFASVGLLSQHIHAAEKPGENSRIVDGSSVTLLFQITVPGEREFEVTNVGKFIQGQHQLLPALERVVTGMKTGDEKKVELSPDEGFGPYDVRKKKTIPRRDVPSETMEGDVLEDRTGQQVVVTRLSDSAAVVDYNHPLAGKPLVVKLKILRVDDPS